MKVRKGDLYIRDILDAIERIQEYTFDMDIEDFIQDRKTVDAVVRNLEIIGEAAKIIPAHIREMDLLVPWSEMARIRDKLIHGYFEIQYEIIWTTVIEDLPPVKTQLESLLDRMDRRQ